MNNLLESAVSNNIIGFLHLITDEKSMIPLRFFPYFILTRLNISENGQLMYIIIITFIEKLLHNIKK